MTFKQILPRLAARPDDKLGLFVVEWILQNRLDHERTYRSGDITGFCHKEMNRVHSGLESLANSWREPSSPESLATRYVQERLGRYRQISRICYGYDVVKALYQSAGGEPEARISDGALFVGEKLRKTTLSRPDGLDDYRWQKETSRQEYIRILAAMKNGLNERTGIIYKMFE